MANMVNNPVGEDRGSDVVALARCESCGHRAHIRLADGSTWCEDCNVAAHHLGYDQEVGVPV